MPSKDQVRAAASDIAFAVGLEIVMVKVTRRLKYGRTPPKRGLLRRIAGAALAELVKQGAAEVYWQRQRMRAAVEHAAAVESVAASQGWPTRIPQQRAAPQTSRAHLPASG